MKKTLAILLSCVLLVCAFFAVALITSADTGTNATSVTVIKADGTIVSLGQQPIVDPADGTVTGYDANNVVSTLAAGEGSLAFDAATGVLTMTNASGIAKIQPANGDATVTVVGTNTIDSVIVTDDTVLNGNNALWNYSGSLTINGSGSLKIVGGSYLIGSQIGDVVIDGPTLDLTASGWTAVHTGSAGLDGSITIKGETVLTINSVGPAFDAQGITPAIYVGGDAKLTLNCRSANAFNLNANQAVTAEIPNASSTLELSGNADVNVVNANVVVNAVGIANNNHSSVVKISDSAKFKAVAYGQGIVVNAAYAGGVQAVLQITGQANVDIDTTANNGQYGQGLDVRPGGVSGSDVDITTTGEVKLKTCAAGWSGAFFLRNGGPHDVLIKDVTLTVENTSSDSSEVVNAIYAQSNAKIVVAGNAKITAVSTQNSTVKANRAFGIYLAADSVMTVQDNAAVVAKSSGTANLGWATAAAALYLNKSTVNVTGNASLSASTTVSTASAFVTENVSALNVSGKGSVVLESEKALAIYAGGTPSVSVVEGGSVTAKGASAASNLKTEQVTGSVKGELIGAEFVIASKTVAAPAGLAYADVTASSAKLTWTAVAEAVAYKVYANGVLVATVDTNEAIVTLIPETAYSITVAAVNAADLESAPSAAVTFTTPSGQSSVVAPAAPTGLAVSGVTKSGATVTWTAVEGATGYDVYVNGTKVTETAVSTASYNVTGLAASTTYKVAVTASNIVGASEKSSEVSFTTGKDGVTDSVTVTFADGTTATLSSSKPSVSAATGTIVFDSLTGEVTITDVTGVQSIIGDGKYEMTVIAKGTNVLETATQTNSLKAGYLVIAGDGKLTVTNSFEKAYPVLGQSSVTIRGSVDFTLNSPETGNGAIHISRGSGTATAGVATFTVSENAKVTIDSKGACIQPKGEYASVIITDNAVVNVKSSTDAIQCAVDSDVAEYTGVAKAYVEISGKAKVTIDAGSCGIRCHYAIDGKTHTGLANVGGISEVVISGSPVIKITSPGQCIYAVATPSNTTGTDKATITISDTPTITINNTGSYAGIHLNSDANTLTILGGAIEIYAPQKSAFAITGRTTLNVGGNATEFLAGDDAESAKDVSKINYTAKYFKIYFNNPATSDVTVAPVAVILVLGAVAVAAAVILRKRSYNA